MGPVRTDEQWLHDLRSQDESLRADALRDLREMLLRGLAKSLSRHGRVDDAFLEDIAQESSLKILDKLGDFAGRSKFRTWAVTIAVHAALSAMRKREWRNVSLDSLTSNADLNPQLAVDRSETAEQQAQKTALLTALRKVIDSDLSQKQWQAITAELRGMPLAEVAHQMGSTPNALYKLLHDARKKLRGGLESAGFTIDDVQAALP